ncbi:DUF2817 domain-containing protein [Bacillus sp. FF-1]|uniref:DUF2817 domain-containing protein n=1 Tax=Bacillus sp. FF-1 TaxID=3025192 RepID=UPI000A438461|nr:DUF2817 domain-containing protein [Bacillus sp. FF-1]MDC7739773.1 DUF2817 domain-containing protein [Bacillus sp. FF-1]
MNNQSYEITVDTQKSINHSNIEFSQNNLNISELIFNITEDGKELPLKDTDEIIVYFKKPDKTVVFQDKEIELLDKSKGKVKVLLTTQTLVKAGDVEGEISIGRVDNGMKKRTSTYGFSFKVRSSLASNDSIESTNEFQMFDQLLELGKQDIPAIIDSKETAEQALKKSEENANQIGILSKDVSENNSYYFSTKLNNTINFRDLTPDKIYQMLDTISHPYLSSQSLGKDQSGQYDVKFYKYEPRGFQQTVYIIGAIHGWEDFGPYAIVQLLKILTGSEAQLPPQLKNIKEKVRILTIPIVNPWGMYQNPKKRQNSNGVDLNRNFNWNWASNKTGQPWDYDYKGTAPFSEKESQYVKKVFDDYKGKISAFIDIHNQEYSNQWDYLVYPDDRMVKELGLMLNYLTKDMTNPVIVNTVGYNDSSSNNYASKVMNIPSTNIEAVIGRFGNIGGDVDNNKWLEFVFNTVLVASTYYAIDNSLPGFSVKNINKTYLDGTVVLTNNVLTDIAESVVTFIPPFTGHVTVNGYLLAKQSNSADIFVSRLVMEQPGFITQLSSFNNAYTTGTVNPIIPLDLRIPVKSGLPVTLKIVGMNQGSGTCNIKRFNMSILYQVGSDLNLFSPGAMEGFTYA